jgi:hypothetical protein
LTFRSRDKVVDCLCAFSLRQHKGCERPPESLAYLPDNAATYLRDALMPDRFGDQLVASGFSHAWFYP